MSSAEFIKVFVQSQENPAVHWGGYLRHPLREKKRKKKKGVSWHWYTCRRSSNTSPYDFSCFADCVWRSHTPRMDWICSLPSQDLWCSNQHTRCSDIYNCIIFFPFPCSTLRVTSRPPRLFAHGHIFESLGFVNKINRRMHVFSVSCSWIVLSLSLSFFFFSLLSMSKSAFKGTGRIE